MINTLKQKLLILGLDGASLALMEKWAGEGKLPYFSRLMKEGAWGLLKSTPSFGSASAWPSFYTGLNPGRHGMFDFFFKEKNSYTMQWMTKRYYQGEPFWKTASQQGLKSAIVNMPVTYPVDPFNGIQVACWMTPSDKAKGFTHPAKLAGEIRQKVGRHIFAPSAKAEINQGDYLGAGKSLRNSFEYKQRLCEYLLKKDDYDIFAHTWIATDQVGHYFWHLLDETHPHYDAKLAEKYAGIALEIYQMCDHAVEKLHKMRGGTLIVMSDHGTGVNPLGEPHLKSLLKETGLMTMRSGESGKAGIFSQTVSKVFETMQGLLGRPIKRFLIANFPGLLNFALTRQNLSDVDWSKTQVYTFIEPTVNLQGREPEGIISLDQQEAVLRQVEEILYSARDSRTGQKAVEKVYRKEEVYHGAFTPDAPDLLVIWNQNISIESLELEYQGRKIRTSSHYIDHRTGNHKPYGIYFIAGEEIKPGLRDDSLEIIDICPLILHLSGCKIPDDLDGRLPGQLLKDDILKAHPPVYFHRDDSTKSVEAPYESEEDKAAAKKRLQDLGYL